MWIVKAVKRLIILWAIKKIKVAAITNSYAELENYGIKDVLIHETTKERMYIF